MDTRPSSGGEKIKIIWARPKPVGLFSLFLQALEQIGLCEREGSTPAVYLNATCLYWNEEGYRGARNAWEYYFYPVSEIDPTTCVPLSRERLEHADIYEFDKRRVFPGVGPLCTPERVGSVRLPESVEVSSEFPHLLLPVIFDPSRRQRRELGALCKRRIRVKEEITEKVDAFSQKNFAGRYVIAAHIRGNEHADERGYFVRDGVLGIECYFREIDAALRRHPDAAIFCASDGAHYIAAVRERYGDRVVSYEAKRLTKEEEHIGVQNLQLSNKAVLGDDVLIETLLLSRADLLVHGPSNVVTAALIFNPEMANVNVFIRYGKWFPKQRYYLRRQLDNTKLALSRKFPGLYAAAKRTVGR